jgi:transmembrane sensor
MRTTNIIADDVTVIRLPGEAADAIEEIAALAVMRLNAGSMGAADIVQLEIWRAESADHDRVFQQMQHAWDAVEPCRTATPRAWAGIGRRARRPAWLVATAIAASLVAGLSIDRYVSTWRYDYRSSAGEIRTVTLPDGTRASMTGDTALAVDITDAGERRVEVARGDAYFEVVHDDRRPFVVTAGSARVEDIGTGFSVALQGRIGTVDVAHGVVKVTTGGRSTILRANEHVDFGAGILGAKSAVDTRVRLGWLRGLYFAENEELGAVIARVDDFYPGRIFVTSDALSRRRINAVVQLRNPGAWLDALGKTHGVSVRRIGPVVLIAEDRSS